jgi:glycine hydroxymethyltransferase
MSVSEPVESAREAATLLRDADPTLYRLLARERVRQSETLVLVAASSLAFPAVLACAGSDLTNLTAEGFPGARYHAGCGIADEVEQLAVDRACSVFGAQDAVVQPHSGSSANLSVLTALLDPGDVLMGLDLDCGGHLTHGSPASLTGRLFRSVGYRVGADGYIDFAQVRAIALESRPRVLICGASAYPRTIDFLRFREIADEAGAILVADISHIAGLVAAGLHPSPVDVAHVVTTSTYKQLYGPRGGLILLGRDAGQPSPRGGTWSQLMHRAVFPLTQGTPDLAGVAAKASALGFVGGADFPELAKRLLADAAALGAGLRRRGLTLVTRGTDNHMVLVDLRPWGISGDVCEEALESCGIVVNRNRVPGDATPARVTSGLRFGTNTIAARGMGPAEANLCADLVADVLDSVRATSGPTAELRAAVRDRVSALCSSWPLAGCLG